MGQSIHQLNLLLFNQTLNHHENETNSNFQSIGIFSFARALIDEVFIPASIRNLHLHYAKILKKNRIRRKF